MTFIFISLTVLVLYIVAPTYEFPKSVTASNRIDKRLLKLFSRHQMGGAYLISQNGQITNEKYAGYKNYFSKVALDEKSLFSLGTLSQQYTGSLYFNLINRQVINPDHKVKLFVSELSERFTGEQNIRDLLSMKPRNPHHFKRGRVLKWQLGLEPTRAEIMKQLDDTTPAHFCSDEVEDGCYSRLSYTILGVVLENFMKKKWKDIFQEKIINKYDLKDTYFNLQNSIDLVRGHYPITKSKVPPIPAWNHNYAIGASGVRATLRDVYKFQLALNDQMKLMLTPTKYFDQSSFSYGWHRTNFEGEDVFWTRGDDIGFYGLVVRVPAKDLIAVFLFNIDQKRREDFHGELMKIFRSMIPKF